MTAKFKSVTKRRHIVGLLFLALLSNQTQAQTAPTNTPASPVQANNLRPVLSEASQAALTRATESGARVDRIRDQYRHPFETLSFFGINSSDTVIEIWPGQGWYSSILAPYLKSGGGHFIAAHFDTTNSNSPLVRQVVDNYRSRFAGDVERFGYVDIVAFGPRSGPLGAANSVDYVLTYRNVHNWMNQGWAEKAFEDFFKVLKPGGYLGIEEHRAGDDAPQDPLANDGYVRQDYVIDMALEAGFVLVESSEINANPRDTRDHPFGVWTLPPVSRTAPQGRPDNPSFDQRPYLEIGESDRMTLLFRKPIAPIASIQAAATGPQPVRMVFSPPPSPPPILNNSSPATADVTAQPLSPPAPSTHRSVPESVPVVFAPPPPPPAPITTTQIESATPSPDSSIGDALIVTNENSTPGPANSTSTNPPNEPSNVVAAVSSRQETIGSNPPQVSAQTTPSPTTTSVASARTSASATTPPARQASPAVRPSSTPKAAASRSTQRTERQTTTNSTNRPRPSTTTTNRNPSSSRPATTRPSTGSASRQTTTTRRPTTSTPAPTKAKAKAAPTRAYPNEPSWNPPPKKKRN